MNKLATKLYNPHEQSKEQLIQSFVVRHKMFQKLFQEIKSPDMKTPGHCFILGQRGMGKTTLLLRLSYEIENDSELNKQLVPVILKEEAFYRIRRLFRLWETIALELENKDSIFSGLYENMQNVCSENADYERIYFEMLNNILKKHSKKIILFIDNLAEMFQNFNDKDCRRLLYVLKSCPNLRIIGASTVMLKGLFKYGKAFSKYFNKHFLEGLNKKETHALLLELAKTYKEENIIKTIIKDQAGRAESLRIMAGGVIRTMISLFEIFIDRKDGNAIGDLENILDRVTPLYKHRMEDLNPLQREVVDAIALNWDAISLEEIAGRTRMKLKEITPVLTQLENLFIIQKVPHGTLSELFHLQERFFNIWYLMRLAPVGSRTRIIWLVRFLESWYSKDELVQRARKHIEAISKGGYHPRAAYYITEALARTAKLDIDTEHELISITKKYLLEKDKTLVGELSQSDKELLEQGNKYLKNAEYEKALKLFLKSKNRIVYFLLGYFLVKSDDNEKSKIYLSKAAKTGDKFFLYGLGFIYSEELKDFDKAEKYWKIAADKGQTDAMYNLGVLYDKGLKDHERAEKYYLMAVENGHAGAMFNLGVFFDEDLKDYEKAKKYYLMAIKKGHADAMYNLGFLYDQMPNDVGKAEKFYLMAAENGHADAMCNLGFLYQYELKDIEKAEKYYMMAVEKGHAAAMHNLAVLYFEHKKEKDKAVELSEEAVYLDNSILNAQFLAKVYLWNDQLENSICTINELLDNKEFVDEYTLHLREYLMLLIAKEQDLYITEYFETSDLNFKERFKPLYYALLHFKGDKNYHKIPPELIEPVYEIIEKIRQMAVEYT